MDSSRINLKAASDEQLLAAFLVGDKSAFSSLVERYQRDLFQFLARFLGSTAAADDVFQETFIQVYQSATQFETDRKFRPWLFTIAANKARDYLRSNNRRKSVSLQAGISPQGSDDHSYIELLPSHEVGPYDNLESDELKHRVMDAIQLLPENLREVLLMAYFHQFPYKQIADALHIPLGTVKSRLHSAVDAFANIWKSANTQAA